MQDKKGLLLVVSGFSGAGKGTIVTEFIKRYEGYELSVSATTRQPREGEINGVHYHFITKEEFEDKLQKDDLIEYNCYQGNYYGTPKSFVEQNMAEGRNVILEIDVNGGGNIRKLYPDAVLVFVTAPSAEILASRLRGRGTDTEEKVIGRLKRAAEETEYIKDYDYLLVNDDRDEAVDAMQSIVQYHVSKEDKKTVLPENVSVMSISGKEINSFADKFKDDLISITKGE